MDYFHCKYSTIHTNALKVGMNILQKWIEEVLQPNKTFLTGFSTCIKGVGADLILIPQGSTGSSIFFDAK